MKDRSRLCSVNICENKKPSSGKDFFYFPKNQVDRHNAWIRACYRDKGWKPSISNSMICQDHFDSSDFIPISAKKRLKKDAIPHLNLDPSVIVNVPTGSLVTVCLDNQLPPKKRQSKKSPFVGQASKHWLSKSGTFKKCFVCDEKTDWQCGALICQKAMCLSPCFSKHQDHYQSLGTYNYIYLYAII